MSVIDVNVGLQVFSQENIALSDLVSKPVENKMVCLIDVDPTKGIEGFHGVDGAIKVSTPSEHRVESQNDVQINNQPDGNRENPSYLRFVLLATSVEVQRDQVAKHVFRADALPILFEI